MISLTADTEIWNGLLCGKQDALLALYNRHYLGLINYGIKLTGNRDMASEAITQVLLQLWDRKEHLPEVSNVRSYLLTCLRRELMGTLQREKFLRKKQAAFLYETADAEPSYEDCLIQLQTNEELKATLRKTFALLSEREKELLQLKFFEDLGYNDISARCRITRRTAYNIIHTALKKIREALPKDVQGSKINSNLSLLSILLFLDLLQ